MAYTQICYTPCVYMEYSFSTKSLQSLCLDRMSISLEYYSPELLSCVPPALRHRLFLQSPIVDVCRYEKTCAFDNINADKLWGELYSKHWKCYDQWHCDVTVTTKSEEIISDCATTNREKYFILLTTIIFSFERPTGYFSRIVDDEKRINYEPPKGVATGYPIDIVNYLIAAHISVVVGKKVAQQNIDEMDDDDDDQWYPVNNFPVYQRDLDDSRDDTRLSTNYDRIAAANQCIPLCYASLAKSGCRIPDEDAILLIMDQCNYYPKTITILCAPDSKLWSWKQEDLKQLFTKFFHDITAIHLCVIDEPGEISSLVESVCFSNRLIPCTLYLSLLYELSSLHYISSMISQLILEKLHIYSPFDFDLDDNASKELGEVVSHQKGNICELKFHECQFPEEANFLSNVTAVIQSPHFTKFQFHGYLESPSILIQLLNAFLCTLCSHAQQLYIDDSTIVTLDSKARDLLRPMPSAICDSSLQHKSLKVENCSATLCSALLRLKPLSLQTLHLQFVCSHFGTTSVSEGVHSILESVAHNDELCVSNLALLNCCNSVFDIHESLPKGILKSIFKRPLLKSLMLDLKLATSNLITLTDALQIQSQLGTLEKLKISFSAHEILKETCDLELLLETVFNLPQISRFSLHLDILLEDLTIVETIQRSWRSKNKPKEFCFGHFHELTIPEHIQSLLNEMQLVVMKEYCIPIRRTVCENVLAPAEHSMICMQNL